MAESATVLDLAAVNTADRFPVVEIFGPTIQGEGALAGLPTHFVRFGYCDFRCSWCDSMHAVDPRQVKENAKRKTATEIAFSLPPVNAGAEWVTLSGGNPAIHDLTGLVWMLEERGYSICVETQGTVWRDWLSTVDVLTVSPKPPSSGMTARQDRKLPAFMDKATRARRLALKIVVFDDTDYEWASTVIRAFGKDCECFLSVGTDRPDDRSRDLTLSPDEETVLGVARRYRWLCERAAPDPVMANVKVLPQLHVIAWGHALGV